MGLLPAPASRKTDLLGCAGETPARLAISVTALIGVCCKLY
jgi:hypothetical protein